MSSHWCLLTRSVVWFLGSQNDEFLILQFLLHGLAVLLLKRKISLHQIFGYPKIEGPYSKVMIKTWFYSFTNFQNNKLVSSNLRRMTKDFGFFKLLSQVTHFYIFNVFKSIAVILYDTQIVSSLVSGNLFIWLLCCLNMIPVFWYSVSAPGFVRDNQAGYIFCPRTILSQLFFSTSLFFFQWELMLETTIWMFWAFVITELPLFLGIFGGQR